MQSPPITVDELLDEIRQVREWHEKEKTALRITLRDELAARVLPSLVGMTLLVAADAAKMAYEFADAMLAEREKGVG